MNDCDTAETCTGTSATCPADSGDQCDFRDTPQIAPTGTTCQQFRDGSSLTLSAELYTKKGNVINSVSPGVFFLYDGVNISTAGNITVTESNTNSWSQPIGMQQDQAIIYRLDCVRVQGVTVTSLNGTVTISNVPAGSYIMSVKYDPGTLVGFSPPTVSTTCQFAVSANSVSSGSAGVLVKKK